MKNEGFVYLTSYLIYYPEKVYINILNYFYIEQRQNYNKNILNKFNHFFLQPFQQCTTFHIYTTQLPLVKYSQAQL